MIALCALTFSVEARKEVHVDMPGTLHELLGKNEHDEEIAVSGTINAADMVTLCGIENLRVLDMSRAFIAAYSGEGSNGENETGEGLIPTGMFAGSRLESVMLPESQIVTIGTMAFADSPLRSVKAGQIATIGAGAFAKCHALEEINMGYAETIGPSAFTECNSLQKVTNAQNVGIIGDRAFQLCKALKEFDFGAGLRSIGDNAFYGCGLIKVDLSGCKELKRTGDFAFGRCADLTSVNLNGSGLQELGKGCFFHCISLREVKFNDMLTVVPAYFLAGSEKADAGNLPDGTTRIGEYALSGNRTQKFTLPASLSTLEEGSMEGMCALDSIDATKVSAVPTLNGNIWEGINQEDVTLLSTAELCEEFMHTPQWQDFNISMPTGVDDFKTDINAVHHYYNKGTLRVWCEGCEIKTISVVDAKGSTLLTKTPMSIETTVDLHSADATIFLIMIDLSDGTHKVLKLAQ